MAKIFEMCDVWGDGSKEYTAIKMNVKDNDSEDTSKLLELLLDGVSKFSVDKDGTLTAEAYQNLPAEIMISASPEKKELVVENNAVTFVSPYAMKITEVRAFVSSPPLGDELDIDIALGLANVALSISDGSLYEKVPVDIELPDENLVTIDISQVGSTFGGAGLKITLKGTRL